MKNIRFHKSALPSHGCGWVGHVGVQLTWGKHALALRVGIGGYGWYRPWWKPYITNYWPTAFHFGIGPTQFSVIPHETFWF
jgi:hypothetical protein